MIYISICFSFDIFKPEKHPLLASNPIGNVFDTSPTESKGRKKQSEIKLLRDVPKPTGPSWHASLNFPSNAALVLKG